jgi:hypothetical protein
MHRAIIEIIRSPRVSFTGGVKESGRSCIRPCENMKIIAIVTSLTSFDTVIEDVVVGLVLYQVPYENLTHEDLREDLEIRHFLKCQESHCEKEPSYHINSCELISDP